MVVTKLGWKEGLEADSSGSPVGKVWQGCLEVCSAAIK